MKGRGEGKARPPLAKGVSFFQPSSNGSGGKEREKETGENVRKEGCSSIERLF
jgi:hypothetical protein